MDAGKLTEKIIVEKLVVEVNEYGEDEITQYVPSVTTRGHVIYDGQVKTDVGNELLFIDEITINLRLYLQKYISNSDRIIISVDGTHNEGDVYEILSVFPDKVAQMLTLKCKKVHE